MKIEVNEREDYKSDVYLMDGKNIVKAKTFMSSHLARDLVINITNQYSLGKDTEVSVNGVRTTLDDYIKN